MNGDKIINLVDSNPTKVVKDVDGNIISGYRIVWNDGNSWYPKAGVVANLVLPQTIILNAANTSGAGMPYLVCPDTTFIPFNTDMCTVIVNGIDVTETSINPGDHLIHYGNN
jgi:hypothetical protein